MIYEYCKFANNHTVTYKDFSEIRKDRVQSEKSKENLIQRHKNKTYNGYMSKATARKCKEHINVLINALRYGTNSNRKATFVTLTLPATQFHEDNYIKRHFLNYFITSMKRKTDLKHLFWRAEAQKNDNIHFHILCDCYIDKNLIRGHWNRILHKHGYIQQYRHNQLKHHKKGFTVRKELLANWSISQQRKAYDYGMKSDWQNPNSSDIHALYSINNVAAYICKYMTKAPDSEKDSEGNIKFLERPINGRIWGTTKELKKYKYFKAEVAAHDFEMSAYNYKVTDYLNKLENDLNTRYINDEFIDLYLHKKPTSELLQKHSTILFNDYKRHYANIYSQLY